MQLPDMTDHNRQLITIELGARAHADRVTYTAWCLSHNSVEVVVRSIYRGTRTLTLAPIGSGYFRVEDFEGRPDDRYTFTIDGDANIPDFASRFQPDGVFESSMVVASSGYEWQTLDWTRPAWGGQVIYELHIGTFTREGTYAAASEKLDYLKELGVTAIEIMPLADWAGKRNWGYDGVMLMAPSASYGTPEQLRMLVDACHLRGIAVILDVVFNHLGSEGNVSNRFCPWYFHHERNSPWGSNFSLDGQNSAPVRAFLLQVLDHWLTEYRIDGFRMDATHAIHDESETHFMAEMTALVHHHGGFVIAEDERNEASVLLPASKGGWECDATWSDDFHHSIQAGQLGHDEIYRDSYLGTPQELGTILKEGWLYHGQLFPFTKKARGTEFPGMPANAIYCLSNHDQTGNRINGEYLHHLILPDRYRAVSLFFLLAPYTPMLFMGQEWACNSPFYFFTDLPGDLGKNIHRYRKEEAGRLFWNASDLALAAMPDPQAITTFQNSKLDWSEQERPSHQGVLSLYREGLKLRRKLFGNTNPAKKDFTVLCTESSVSIRYALGSNNFLVTLFFSGAESHKRNPARVLLSSNDMRFTEDELGDAETVVTNLND